MKPDSSICTLFIGLTDSEMSQLSSCMKEKRLEEGVSVFIENMPGESLFMIETGSVRITKMLGEGEETSLAVLGPHDCFGEMALIEPGPRSVTARVLKSASLWSMKKSDFDTLCKKNPLLGMKLMKNILKTFVQRVRGSDEQIRDVISCGGQKK